MSKPDRNLELRITARNLLQKVLRLTREEANARVARLSLGQHARLVKAADYPEEMRLSTILRVSSEGLPSMLPLESPGPAARRVRLRRAVHVPGGTGPWNGQYALQKAVRESLPDWLSIDGPAADDELLWIWCWEDMPELLGWLGNGRPAVAGPNVLFRYSSMPRICGEDIVCDSPCVRLLFTESDWYADLIKKNLGRHNRAPIVLWPYPIDPQPEGPLLGKEAEHDLLIFAKSGPQQLVEPLAKRYPRHRLIRYGAYRRDELIEAARRSRACIYFSDDDRGPLALAEIMLAGCPAVGIPRGAPWIESGRTGEFLDDLDNVEHAVDAIEDLLEWDREAVRAVALEKFSTERIVQTILMALDKARRTHDRDPNPNSKTAAPGLERTPRKAA